MTRSEHLAWAKARALEYVEQGDYSGAWLSLASDCNKHDALRAHPVLVEAMRLHLSGQLNTAQDVRDFIEGFN